jgi:hypothetical protein
MTVGIDAAPKGEREGTRMSEPELKRITIWQAELDEKDVRIAELEAQVAESRELVEATKVLDNTGALVRLDNGAAYEGWEAEYEDHERHSGLYSTLSAALIALAAQVEGRERKD